LFHGAADEWIPAENSAGFAAALADVGYDVEFATFDGGHTGPPTELGLPAVMEVLGR
jgi:predicted esterase